MSFPAGTEMFQFPACPSPELLYSFRDNQLWAGWVAPFGDLRIVACCQLPGAYRRLPRPSSALVPRHPPCALREIISLETIAQARPLHIFSRASAKKLAKNLVQQSCGVTHTFVCLDRRCASQAQRRYAVFKEQAPHPRPAEARPIRMRRAFEITSRDFRRALFSQS